jgi:hypothetical protein
VSDDPVRPGSFPDHIQLTRDEALRIADAMLVARTVLRSIGATDTAIDLEFAVELIEDRLANPPPTEN